ncbi:MAG: septal ring lytic transglycosylase RlpA family protein [Limnothrix sp. RL_2_0]|nr:septal ring lytic transglycosylase RlpA family protein [Limnothrix sp. RL_2_0]
MTFKRKPFLIASVLLATLAPLSFSSGLALADSAKISTDVIARTQSPDEVSRLDEIATTLSYPYEERTATTLYINRLPVLTFLDPSDATDNSAEAIATQVSDQIENLALSNDFDANKFSVRWQKQGVYELLYADQRLAAIDDSTFLADSTDNREQDALIAVNRFRRILGGAEPITEVANKPKPKANLVAATGRVVRTFQGHASWYGPGFHGRRTANGERFNQNAMTAAHKTLPFGTRVRVTNTYNGRSVVVRINDRGPFIRGREIDLSKGSAQQIGLVSSGVANVKLEILGN